MRQYEPFVADRLNGATAGFSPTRWMLNAPQCAFPVRVRWAVLPNGRTLLRTADRTRQLRGITAGRLWDEAKDIRMLADVTSPFPLYVAGEIRHEGAQAPTHLGPATLLGRLSEDHL